VNVLFITLDQFRGDSYGAAGHPLVQTPTLDASHARAFASRATTPRPRRARRGERRSTPARIK